MAVCRPFALTCADTKTLRPSVRSTQAATCSGVSSRGRGAVAHLERDGHRRDSRDEHRHAHRVVEHQREHPAVHQPRAAFVGRAEAHRAGHAPVVGREVELRSGRVCPAADQAHGVERAVVHPLLPRQPGQPLRVRLERRPRSRPGRPIARRCGPPDRPDSRDRDREALTLVDRLLRRLQHAADPTEQMRSRDDFTRCVATPARAARPRAGVRRRHLVQHRRAADPAGAARPVRAARLLDVLLRQLPARARRAAPARAQVRRRAHRRRRALAQVRARGEDAAVRAADRALRGRPPGAQRPAAAAVAAVRRAGLADARPDRPRGLRRRPGRRRRPDQRARRDDRRPARRARARVRRGDGPVRPADSTGAEHRCASRPRRSRCPNRGDTCWSPTPATTSSSNSSSTARPSCAASAAAARTRGRFAEPNGLALLPPGAGSSYDAGRGRHREPRAARRAARRRRGRRHHRPARRAARRPHGHRRDPAVLSPWDVVWWPALDRLVVAAAGVHLLLAVDPRTGAAEVLAGTTVEGLRDGPALDGWLAQPSGLAVDGDRLWFVDSETSALRWLDRRRRRCTPPSARACSTSATSTARPRRRGSSTRSASPCSPDRSRRRARHLQRRGAPLRPGHRHGQHAGHATCAEPSGAVLGRRRPRRRRIGRAPAGPARAARRARHRRAAAHRTSGHRASRAGAVTLDVRFAPAPGRKLDERYGPSTPADGHRVTAGAARRRRRANRRRWQGNWCWPSGGDGRAARDRAGGVVRRRRASTRPATSPGRTGACPIRDHARRWRPRRFGTSGLRRTQRVTMRWSFAGPSTSHSTRSRVRGIDDDQAAVEIGVARMLDDLAGTPRVERAAVGEAHLPAVAVGDDVQLAGDLVAAPAPRQRAELEPVHHRADEGELEPAGDPPELPDLAVGEAPLELPHAEQVGRARPGAAAATIVHGRYILHRRRSQTDHRTTGCRDLLRHDTSSTRRSRARAVPPRRAPPSGPAPSCSARRKAPASGTCPARSRRGRRAPASGTRTPSASRRATATRTRGGRPGT